MDRQTKRTVAHYMRLHYPVCVTAGTHGFSACYPDLPECSSIGWDLPTLYATLERQRHRWITARVKSGEIVPLPNSHLAEPEIRQNNVASLASPIDRGRRLIAGGQSGATEDARQR